MDHRRLKFFLLGAGVLATMAFLLAVGLGQEGGFSYYVTVGEFLDQSHGGKNVRINGKVAEGSIQRQPTGLDVRFQVTDGSRAIPVAYHGVIPDTFVDGADVVVEGGMGGDGVFTAHSLLAKCPSKYEAAQARGEENPHPDNRHTE